MSANDDLLEILKEALDRAGSVSGRRMFGGVGVYFNGTFFAIIDDGAVYLKISDEMQAQFEAEGSRAFSYMTKKGAAELRTYWRLPERLLDEPDELYEWARASIAAARDVAERKKAPASKSRAKAKSRTSNNRR
ncbi:MAG: TfoX/Sxy family protein [Hyphomicrobium sp.]|uniref:TfoX/Sxy family protein n=1 Tax=Hyphomicrobium sp. TaxID=82 RepID=UPI0039E2795C